MRSPSQALAWSAFSLSWPALLAQIAGVVTVVFLMNLALDADRDSIELLEAAELAILIGLTFLYAAAAHKSHGHARSSTSLGFPFSVEFSLPVSTLSLLTTPLLFYCALIQVAVFVPLTIVNILFFNIEVSILPLSFVIFQFTAFTLMLTWWTENSIANILGWLAALILFLDGWLMPDFVRVENAWVLYAEDSIEYARSIFFTAALFALTYFGVKQQRSGGTLSKVGTDMFNSMEQGAVRDILALPISDCPTSSSLSAELWKERQLHGAYSALFGGLTGAAITLAIFATIVFFAGNGPEPKNMVLLAFPMYALMCVGLTITMYGVRYKNGTPIVSLHDRTAPLSTAKLTLIRTSVSLSSALLAGVIMYATLWILGPLLFSDFQSMQSEFKELFATFTGIGFFDIALILFLSLIAFLTALLLLVTFFTWTMLHNKPFAIAIACVPAYIFLWSILLMGFYGSENADAYNQAIDTVFSNHLWILVLLIPASLAFMLHGLLRDQTLTWTQLLSLLTIGLMIAALNLIWLFGANYYAVLELNIRSAQLGYLVIQSLLPTLAAVLALWTSNKIRHA
jgi:hypothetical protein